MFNAGKSCQLKLGNSSRFAEPLNQLACCGGWVLSHSHRRSYTRAVGASLGDCRDVGCFDATDGDDGSSYAVDYGVKCCESSRTGIRFGGSGEDGTDSDVVCTFIERGNSFIDQRVGFAHYLMGLKDDPTFGNGKVTLAYMYAIGSDFSCNKGRVVDDEEGIVGAADLGDGGSFVGYHRFRCLLVPELNDGCTSGRGRFSNHENVPTTTMVRIDDHVYATDDFGGGWTEGHCVGELGF